MGNNLSIEVSSFLNKSTTQSFLLAATIFVELLESKDIDIDTFCKKAYEALVVLYATGVQLEPMEKISNSDFDRDELFENYNMNRIVDLNKATLYWEVEPAFTEGINEASLGDLSDDFSDIYRDLKVELQKIKMQTDDAIVDALWQLKWSFKYHWGRHCIDALRYLHHSFF